jgi:hypothetical protein
MMRHSAANGRGRGNSDSRTSPPGRRLNTGASYFLCVETIIYAYYRSSKRSRRNVIIQ